MIHLPVMFEHGPHTINVEEVAAITERPQSYTNMREAEAAYERRDYATVIVTLRSGRELEAKKTSTLRVLADMRDAADAAVAALEAAQ